MEPEPTARARAATLQAIYRNKERVFNPNRKDHHWGKRKLKRDLSERKTRRGLNRPGGLSLEFLPVLI